MPQRVSKKISNKFKTMAFIFRQTLRKIARVSYMRDAARTFMICLPTWEGSGKLFLESVLS